jgi:hypothetical protein
MIFLPLVGRMRHQGAICGGMDRLFVLDKGRGWAGEPSPSNAAAG